MIELSSITNDLYRASQRLENASVELFKMGNEKVESEKIYRVKMAQEMLTLKAGGMAIGMIEDVAKGNVAEYLFKRDYDEVRFKSAIKSIEALQTQVSALQSILKYQDEI